MGYLFVLQLKICHYLHRPLLRVLDGLCLAAEEGVHLCLSLTVFGNTNFKYLDALFSDFFLKCKFEVKEKKVTTFSNCHLLGFRRFNEWQLAKDMFGEEGPLRAHTVLARPLGHLSACS